MLDNRPLHGLGVAAFLVNQSAWSRQTFGPGARTAGVVQHIRKELREVRDTPSDPTEWADIAILALDGVWRTSGDTYPALADHHRSTEDNVLTNLLHSDNGRSVRDALRAIAAQLTLIEPDAVPGGPVSARNRARFERIASIAIAGGTRWCGLHFDEFRRVMWDKLERNMARRWPDWRQFGEDQAIEHDRTGERAVLEAV